MREGSNAPRLAHPEPAPPRSARFLGHKGDLKPLLAVALPLASDGSDAHLKSIGGLFVGPGGGPFSSLLSKMRAYKSLRA